MLDGFGYVLAQSAVLLLAAVALGVVVGRFLWPRRTTPSSPAAPSDLLGLGAVPAAPAVPPALSFLRISN